MLFIVCGVIDEQFRRGRPLLLSSVFTKKQALKLMSFPAGIISRPLVSSSETTPLSTTCIESTEKPATRDCYSHILTHQEKKKQRMPKHKANAWPTSILTDPDVLSLDDEGRFVLCKVCHVHYAVHGGKKPKPVIMNSSFRCRAWEVHKERTNSHRLHKKSPIDTPRAPSHSDEEEQKESGHHTHSSDTNVHQPLPPRQQHVVESLVADGNSPHFAPPPPTALLAAAPLLTGEQPNKHQTSPRRRIFRQSPSHAHGQKRQWSSPPSHDLQRRMAHHEHERSRVPQSSTHVVGERTAQPSMTNAEQSNEYRWRNMHEDVTRALHKRPMSSGYEGQNDNGGMQMSETEDFAGNNERVAKKLRSLDEEYDAKVLKRPEACFDRHSEMYKQYWGTLRDVYNSANQHTNQTQAQAAKAAFRRQDEQQQYGKESMDDLTTPDDSGSNESVVKPVVVHDQALINALDRLTGVISKQFSERYSEETAMLFDAVGKLTHAVDDMRMHQGATLNRLVQLQEQKLHVMEDILRHKLEKHPVHSRPNSSSTEVKF